MFDFDMTKPVATFLTLPGTSEAAVGYYQSLFGEDLVVTSTTLFKEGQRGEVGKVMNMQFTIKGHPFMLMDMEQEFLPDLTWAFSILIICKDEAEFDHLLAGLAVNGNIMMGPESVNGLSKVAWVTDAFGITWQLIFE